MIDFAIRCRSVHKRFDTTTAVADLSLTLRRGHILALLGPSGCGKTTALRLLAGFETPEEGEIEIAGRVVVDKGHFVCPEQRRVGMVFQDYALFPHLDVAANVAYGLPKGNGREPRVKGALSLVGLADVASRMPHELSGGQQQRVALARALATEPEVILLDEPFSNLDAKLRAGVRLEVREILRGAGATAVFVTHDQQEALSLADEVAVMLGGRIAQVGTPEDIYCCPATKEVATFVGEVEFLPGEIADGMVRCELGVLRSRSALAGKVEVMLRPENVDLAPDREGVGEVVRHEFFGHDRLVTVRLPSGGVVRARLESGARFSTGDRVRIRVRNELVVFSPRNCRRDTSTLSATDGCGSPAARFLA